MKKTPASSASGTSPVAASRQSDPAYRVRREEPAARSLPEIFSLQSLLARRSAEPEWVIPGLLPIGVSLLAGPAQIDKPLLANQLGLSVATGRPFLAHFSTCQGHVLYLALSEDVLQVRGRATRLLREQTQPANFTVALRWSPLRESGLADLEDTIADLNGLNLVIIDSLEFVQPLHAPFSSGNRLRQTQQPVEEPGFFMPLRELAARYQLAILLLHHLPDDWPANRRDPLAGLSVTGLTTATACNWLLMPGTGTGRGHEVATCTLHLAGQQVEDRRIPLAFDVQQGNWHWRETLH